jgi:hypothetical protein
VGEQTGGIVLAWVGAGILAVLMLLSLSGGGTVLGGVAMGWMMVIPLLFLGLVVWAAYRYGRMSAKAEGPAGQPRP